jgi:hypothetical protein
MGHRGQEVPPLRSYVDRCSHEGETLTPFHREVGCRPLFEHDRRQRTKRLA